MGEAHAQLKLYPRALRYYDQALASSRAAEDRAGAARQLLARGALEGRLGNFASARASLTAAVTEQEQLFGSAHPLVAETRVALAGIDFASGAHRPALAAALSAEATSRDYLRQTLRYLPERQALTFAERRARGLDLAISIAVSRAAVPTAPVLDGVIQSRGLVLDELAGRRHSAGPADPKVAELVAAANRARQRFANLLVLSVDGAVPRNNSTRPASRRRRPSVRWSLRAPKPVRNGANGHRTGCCPRALPREPRSCRSCSTRSLSADKRRAGPQVPVQSFVAFVVNPGRQAPVSCRWVLSPSRAAHHGMAREAAGATLLVATRPAERTVRIATRKPSSSCGLGSVGRLFARYQSRLCRPRRRYRFGIARRVAGRQRRICWKEGHRFTI